MLFYSPDGSSDSENEVVILQSHSRFNGLFVSGEHTQQWIGRSTLAPMFMNLHNFRVKVFITAIQPLFVQFNVVDTH